MTEISFFSPYRHDFVRVGVCTPRTRPADPEAQRGGGGPARRGRRARRRRGAAVPRARARRLRRGRPPPAGGAARRLRCGAGARARDQPHRPRRTGGRPAAQEPGPALQCGRRGPRRAGARRRAQDASSELPGVLRGALVHPGRGRHRPHDADRGRGGAVRRRAAVRGALPHRLHLFTWRSARTGGLRSRPAEPRPWRAPSCC